MQMILTLTALLTWLPVANAGCWIVWKGASSHLKCDGAGATPTFEKFKDAMEEIQGLSPQCIDAVGRLYGTYFECGVAVYGAVMSEGALIVGAQQACKHFTKELNDAQDKCGERLNVRTQQGAVVPPPGQPAPPKPTIMKACNRTSKLLQVGGAEYNGFNNTSKGWVSLASGQCQDIMSVKAQGYLYATDNLLGGKFYKPRTNPQGDAFICVDPKRHFHMPTFIDSSGKCKRLGADVTGFPASVLVKRLGVGGVETWNIVDGDGFELDGTVVRMKNNSPLTRTFSMSFAFQTQQGTKTGMTHQSNVETVPNGFADFYVPTSTGRILHDEAGNGLLLASFRLTLQDGQVLLWGENAKGLPYGLPFLETLFTSPKTHKVIRLYEGSVN